MAAGGTIVEVGPRLNFSTAWSANAVSICESCGVSKVNRIEQSRRCDLAWSARFNLYHEPAAHEQLAVATYVERTY